MWAQPQAHSGTSRQSPFIIKLIFRTGEKRWCHGCHQAEGLQDEAQGVCGLLLQYQQEEGAQCDQPGVFRHQVTFLCWWLPTALSICSRFRQSAEMKCCSMMEGVIRDGVNGPVLGMVVQAYLSPAFPCDPCHTREQMSLNMRLGCFSGAVKWSWHCLLNIINPQW